ncbi:MAG TPA: alanine racemase [Candidatus Eisenbergiella merdigallinarum]|uniref:Alanine racemase n=1 Tax=Candidatus Eisenbergiella merdigallinarum TaxID=2838552 RepID=A0A9D2MQ58_9FIRM|nr:alanine racemase [Candidatus Eisenbergiella merdigallinarum]
MKHYSRVRAEIDLDRFDQNLLAIRKALPDHTSVIGVVKADGYGHGAVPLARRMQECGFVSGFAVATAQEGLSLRRAGIAKPILVLGYSFPEEYEEMVRHQISAAAFTDEMLEQMSRAALSLHGEMGVHVAVDTGMSRIGVEPDESGAAFLNRAAHTPGICLEGAFTHFATADERDKERTNCQFSRFVGLLELAKKRYGVTVPLRHASNSAAVLDLPEAGLDAVRAGIILYGLWPSDEVNRSAVQLQPILSLYSQISFVKTLDAGREISYGGTFRTESPTRVATVPVGYADGYPRGLSNKGEVLICGKRARILGRICMDQFMVDITHIPEAAQGSPVTLIGQDGAERITMEELGEKSGRFNYELACCLSKRIPRVYRSGQKTVAEKDYFDDPG